MLLAQLFKKEHLFKAAMTMYVMAACFAALAAASGLWEADRLHVRHPVLYAHRNYALSTSIFSWVSVLAIWFFRHDPRVCRRVFIAACWLCAILVLTASYFGGAMVYDYGIGVKP